MIYSAMALAEIPRIRRPDWLHGECTHQPLAWGGVPGYWQTVMRAELTVFVFAVCFGVATGQTFAIWSGCEVAISCARRIQQEGFEITSNCTDHDLWMIVQERLPSAETRGLYHIKSHQLSR
jgi:hypothetical protein